MPGLDYVLARGDRGADRGVSPTGATSEHSPGNDSDSAVSQSRDPITFRPAIRIVPVAVGALRSTAPGRRAGGSQLRDFDLVRRLVRVNLLGLRSRAGGLWFLKRARARSDIEYHHPRDDTSDTRHLLEAAQAAALHAGNSSSNYDAMCFGAAFSGNGGTMNVPLRPTKVQTAGAALVLAVAAYRRYLRYRAEVALPAERVEGDQKGNIAGNAEETDAQPA